MKTELLDGKQVPVIEVVKSPTGEPVADKGVPADEEGAMISNVNQEGFVQADDVTATREVISPTTLPLSYQYDEKQMMANVSTAISADIEDMTEAELLADETFGYASKKMFRAFRGEDFTGTDEEATQFGIDLMRRVENNLVELGDFSYQVQDMSSDDAQIALYMMDMFEAKEFTGRGFTEALGYMGLDPTTYIGLGTFGFGFAGKEAIKQATKQGIRVALQKMAYSGATVGAIECGVYTGVFEHGKQVVSEAAGEGYDSGSVGLNVAIGVGAGKYLSEIFDYAAGKVAKWSAAKNFKAEVRAAADAGDADAIKVLADMELLDNHFDSDGFMRRKLDEFEQTRVGQLVTGIQRIVPENRKSVDEIITDAAGLNAKQRKQKLSAAMRDASPEDRQKLIAEMKTSATLPKPKSAKAQEVIMEQKEFNASFYSKLEHEVNKLPDDMVFQNGNRIETTQGMSQAYDIEMPRIIQKTTGETPYMASFETGKPITGEKILWDSKKAQNLEYYDDIAKDAPDRKGAAEWYWKIDYTEALKKKLKDAKIQMYGVGGVALIGANGESLGGEEDAN